MKYFSALPTHLVSSNTLWSQKIPKKLIIKVIIVICIINTNLTCASINMDLMEKINIGNLSDVQLAISNGASINSRNKFGETALMKASYHGHFKIVKYLIENGADVNAKSKIGTTALMEGVLNNNINITKYLIENGADVNAKNIANVNALMIASPYEYIEIIKYLIKHSADVNAKNNEDWTALMYASVYCKIKSIKLLIKNNAQVNVRDRFGATTLIRTISSRYCRGEEIRLVIIKALVKNGADLNIKVTKGWSFSPPGEKGQVPIIVINKGDSALSLAKQFHFNKIVNFFKQHGATE